MKTKRDSLIDGYVKDIDELKQEVLGWDKGEQEMKTEKPCAEDLKKTEEIDELKQEIKKLKVKLLRLRRLWRKLMKNDNDL